MSTDLCLGCHEKVAHSLDQNPMMHTAVKEAKSCLDCHVPHASYSKSLLKGRVGALCISCHDEAIERESGEKIASIKDLFLSTRYWHAPAVEGQCQECHVSHTLDAQKLLFATYPMSLYSDGAEGTYRLCFKCHDDSLLLEDETLSTRFRDGTRNLHRVHLGGKKSRTCATCHEVHAGNVPRLMRATIPFGMSGYVIEVGFQTQQAGGSCGPNCHDAKTYVNASPPGSESLLRYRVESNE
jgi:predicted CXXCH cytochrome family protein